MSEMHADLKAAQQRILALKHNLLELEEAGKRTAERLIQVERRLSDANGEVLRLGLQLKHHLQLQAERDALAAKLAELEGQEPIGEVIHSDVLPNAEEKYRHEFVSDFRIGVQAELFVRPVPAEQHVNARLLEVARAALEALNCSGESDDPGHRCGHCDDYVDRNGVVRAALCDAISAAEAQQAEPPTSRGGPAPWLAWALHIIRERCPDVVESYQFGWAEQACSAGFKAEPVRLADQEIGLIIDSVTPQPWGIGSRRSDGFSFARSIEAAVLRKQGYKVEG